MTAPSTAVRLAVLAILAGAIGAARAPAQPASRPAREPIPTGKFMRRTYVYKTVGDIKIHADVHRADDALRRPVVAWFHGGALIMGSRRQMPGDVLSLCKTEGYILVSFDYRLAPEVKLPAIAEDIKDAIKWLRAKGPELFNADPSRLVISGGSAGGYITMLTGIIIKPRPTALVSYCGYGDVDGAWYAQPSEHYRTKPLVSKERAYAGVYKGVLTNPPAGRQARNARGRFYLYLRQNGLWPKEVTGFDPATQRDKLTPYCPVRNITPEYPPIAMVHGTKDTDVPYEQSANMAKELTARGVRHELLTIPNGGHGCRSGDPTDVAKARTAALAFITEHLAPLAAKPTTRKHTNRFMKTKYVYKTVGEVKIRADVHRTDNGKPQPVVVWFHGGGLTTGDRKWPPGDLIALCKREGYVLVSFDYRLAPEVKLPEIIADVKDGFRWIRQHGGELFQADPSRIVVCGSSAGGYLTLMTGVVIKPRPAAVVTYWAYGDVDGDWVSKPGEFYRKRYALVSKAEAMKGVGKVTTGGGWTKEFYAARKKYNRYLRQNGLWTKEVSGFDAATQRDKLTPYCPVRNITPEYPPTFLVHGTDDTDVPVSKAKDMARELTRHGVAHEMIIIPKAGHRLRGGDKGLVAQARAAALKFVTKHLSAKPPAKSKGAAKG